jgi:hypothetical protein
VDRGASTGSPGNPHFIHGRSTSITGELLTPAAGLEEPEHLITQLRRHMARLRPVPAARHASPTTFLHKDLRDCTHVFLRQDATLRALEPLTPTHTRSSRDERKRCSSLCAASLSPYLPIGSSQLTCWTSPATAAPLRTLRPTRHQRPHRRHLQLPTRSGRHVSFPARLTT